MAKYFLLIPPSRYSLQTGGRQPEPSVRHEKHLSENLYEKFVKDGWGIVACKKDGTIIDEEVIPGKKVTTDTEPAKTREEREKQLNEKSWAGLVAVAAMHDLKKVGIKKGEMIKNILDAEFPEKQADGDPGNAAENGGDESKSGDAADADDRKEQGE